VICSVADAAGLVALLQQQDLLAALLRYAAIAEAVRPLR
jgi:hypothetical protein